MSIALAAIVGGAPTPCIYFSPETRILTYLEEDCMVNAVPVSNSMDLLRHGYRSCSVGIQYWLGYHPNQLLAYQPQ